MGSLCLRQRAARRALLRHGFFAGAAAGGDAGRSCRWSSAPLELHRQGAIAEAERVCLEALELAPTQLDALSLLYQIRKAGNVERAADVLLRRIVALHPNTFWAINQLALALFNKGAVLEAESTPATRCASRPKTRNRIT